LSLLRLSGSPAPYLDFFALIYGKESLDHGNASIAGYIIVMADKIRPSAEIPDEKRYHILSG
jgi:hypothetical protein